jgi:23S rRNA (adenine2030-N6)-methyltransferase
VKEYVDLVKSLNPSGKMRYYPGSPYCAEKIMREQDGCACSNCTPAK